MPATSDGTTGSTSQPSVSKAYHGSADRHHRRQAAQQGAPNCADARQHESQREPQHEHEEELGAGGEIGPLQELAGHDVLDDLGVDFHAGGDWIERRRPDVVQALGTGADKDDLSPDPFRIEIWFQYFPGRDVAIGRPR